MQSTLTRTKFGLFHPKFSVELNEFSFNVLRGRSQKTPKTKIVPKNANMRVSEAKG